MTPWHRIATMTDDQKLLLADCLEVGIEGGVTDDANSDEDVTAMEEFVASLREEVSQNPYKTKLDIQQKVKAEQQERAASGRLQALADRLRPKLLAEGWDALTKPSI